MGGRTSKRSTLSLTDNFIVIRFRNSVESFSAFLDNLIPFRDNILILVETNAPLSQPTVKEKKRKSLKSRITMQSLKVSTWWRYEIFLLMLLLSKPVFGIGICETRNSRNRVTFRLCRLDQMSHKNILSMTKFSRVFPRNILAFYTAGVDLRTCLQNTCISVYFSVY